MGWDFLQNIAFCFVRGGCVVCGFKSRLLWVQVTFIKNCKSVFLHLGKENTTVLFSESLLPVNGLLSNKSRLVVCVCMCIQNAQLICTFWNSLLWHADSSSQAASATAQFCFWWWNLEQGQNHRRYLLRQGPWESEIHLQELQREGGQKEVPLN